MSAAQRPAGGILATLVFLSVVMKNGKLQWFRAVRGDSTVYESKSQDHYVVEARK